MVKAQPQTKTAIQDKKNIKAKKLGQPIAAAKKVLPKKSVLPKGVAKKKSETAVEADPKGVEAAERSAKIQKKKDVKDEIKKFYQNIIVDTKKDSDIEKATINEFMVYFKKNATNVR
jgi:hypothetical protein